MTTNWVTGEHRGPSSVMSTFRTTSEPFIGDEQCWTASEPFIGEEQYRTSQLSQLTATFMI